MMIDISIIVIVVMIFNGCACLQAKREERSVLLLGVGGRTSARTYGVMVSTLDFESNNPSSILGMSFFINTITNKNTICINHHLESRTFILSYKLLVSYRTDFIFSGY